MSLAGADPLQFLLLQRGRSRDIVTSPLEALIVAEAAEETMQFDQAQAQSAQGVPEPNTPLHPSAKSAMTVVMQNLPSRDRLTKGGLHLTYGGDCSGAEAAWHALRDIQAACSAFGVDLHLSHRFSSEIETKDGDAPRKFILQNSTPEVLFDGCVRDKGRGWDRLSSSVKVQPYVDIYVAGWVCKDRSRVNHKKKPLDTVLNQSSGASSITLHASIDYIKDKQPRIVLLEHVLDKTSLAVAFKMLRDINNGIYLVKCFCMNSQTAKVQTSRNRLYLVAIHSKKVVINEEISKWGVHLTEIFDSMAYPSWCDICDEEAGIQAGISDNWHRRRRTTSTGATDAAWRKSKEFKTHTEARNDVRKQFGITIPSLATLLRTDLAKGWDLNAFTTRELDLLCMHMRLAKEACGLDAGKLRKLNLFWDVQYSVKWATFPKSIFAQNSLGCITTGSKILSTRLGRVLTGRELLLIQGFGNHVNTEGISDSCLRRMAGNTISVPVLIGIFALLLRNCTFEMKEELHWEEAAEQQRSYLGGLSDDDATKGIWIGSRKTVGETTVYDRISARRNVRAGRAPSASVKASGKASKPCKRRITGKQAVKKRPASLRC